ncbi:MAG: hypothetical protein ACLRFM_00300 [Alphaproteobacteria bacterium]
MNNFDNDLKKYLLGKVVSMHISPFGGEKWDSSAKKLDDVLRRRGIDFDKKLFWKYKLPNGMSPQEFMDTLLLEFYFVKWFSNMKIMRDKNLTIKQKIKIFAYVLSMKKAGIGKNIKKYANEIKQLNPELAHINPRDNFGSISFVEGALFGFAPDEIKYFCDKSSFRDMDQEHEFDEILKKHGVRPSYVLAPETAKHLIANLEKGK